MNFGTKQMTKNRYGLFFLSAVIFIVATLAITYLRYTGLRMAVADLGLFDQALWNFTHNGVPMSSLTVAEGTGNFLGFHFAPLILIFAPLYYLIESPFLLQIIQILLVVSAIWPIYLCGCTVGLNPRLAKGLALLFLLHPFTLGGTVWDFHEVALAVPLIAWALYAVLAKKFRLLLCTCLLLLLVKEHYGLTVAALGLLWLLRYGKKGKAEKAQGFALILAGLVALVVILLVLMPQLSPLGEHVMLSSDADHMQGLSRYAWLHLPLPEALSFFIKNILITPQTGLYLGLIFFSFWRLSPGGFLLFAAGASDIAAAMASGNPMPRSPLAYHALPLVPVMAIAAAEGLSKINHAERGKQLRLAAIVLCCASYFYAPLPLPGGADTWHLSRLIKHEKLQWSSPPEIVEISALLQANDHVVAQENIGSFFARREMITPLARGYTAADKIILHLDYPYGNFAVTVFANPFEGTTWLAALTALQEDTDFEIIYFKNNWAVFERRDDTHAEDANMGEAYALRLEQLDEAY